MMPVAGTTQRLLLDFERPAQCSGTVNAWRYCFHRPTSNEERRAVFLVYRKDPLTGNSYKVVDNSLTAISFTSTSTSGDQFICQTKLLLNDDKFRIEKNDVVGVCIDTLSPLRTVSENRLGSQPSKLYFIDDSRYDGCLASRIMDTAVDVMGANILDQTLHLSAQIGK